MSGSSRRTRHQRAARATADVDVAAAKVKEQDHPKLPPTTVEEGRVEAAADAAAGAAERRARVRWDGHPPRAQYQEGVQRRGPLRIATPQRERPPRLRRVAQRPRDATLLSTTSCPRQLVKGFRPRASVDSWKRRP